jgi:hypothetical protein
MPITDASRLRTKTRLRHANVEKKALRANWWLKGIVPASRVTQSLSFQRRFVDDPQATLAVYSCSKGGLSLSRRFLFLIVSCALAALSSPSAASQSARPYGEVFAEDFGAVGYDPPPGTSNAWPNPPSMVDSGPALQAAIDAVPMDGVLRFEHCRYLTNQTLIVSKPLTIQVTDSDDRVSYCGFAVKYGIVGLHLKASSTIRGLFLRANSRSGGGAPNSAAHGVLMEASSHLAGIFVYGFEGDGIHIEADTNRTPPTNANQWRIDGGSASTNSGVGLFVRGGDSNAGVALRFSSVGNKIANYHDNSFLGNLYLGCHSDGSARSYESGWDTVNGARIENRNNHSMFLESYEEDGTVADLGANTIWIGGQGEAVTSGDGSVLKTEGKHGGFKAHHFAAVVGSTPVARLGGVDGGGVIAEFWLPGASAPLYVYPSTARPGKIDMSSAIGSSRVALSLSTGASMDGAGFMEAPGEARLGRAAVFGAATKPATTTCNLGDLAINVVATTGKPWGWQCVGTAGNWRELPAP